MKIKNILSFSLIIAVSVLLSIGCDKKKNDYPDADTDIPSDTGDSADTSDTGSDTGDSADTSDTAPDTGDSADTSDTAPDTGDSADTSDTASDTGDSADTSDTASDTGDSADTSDTASDTGDPADSGSEDESDIPEKDDAETVCTGLTECFDDVVEITCPASSSSTIFGQDAQYAAKGYCLDRSISTTAETVTDNITGLVWQKNLPDKYAGCTGASGTVCSHSEAINYCENLSLEGRNDWRLPTPEELAGIIDYGKVNPSIDDNFEMPATTQKQFWTSAQSLASSKKSWAINFLDGSVTEEYEINTADVTKYLNVRCVRGEALPEAVYQENGTDEITVTNQVNGLTWTQKTESTGKWKNALSYCQHLEYAGKKDWRLPNINELKTIVSYSSTNPASDFPGMKSVILWSSTTYSGDAPETAWYANMTTGEIFYKNKGNNFSAICVR